VTQVARDLAVSTSDRLRPIAYNAATEKEDEDEKGAIAETINVGTTLFELYIALQNLTR
jgi:hypothetical protein